MRHRPPPRRDGSCNPLVRPGLQLAQSLLRRPRGTATKMPKTSDAAATDQAVAERRRRSPRRKLPFGRTAVLDIAGRAHLVALVDLSVSGAYLATRSAVPKAGPLRLRIRLPG